MKKVICNHYGACCSTDIQLWQACGSTQQSKLRGTDAGRASEGSDVLRVGMECNYAPYNWSQADDSNGAVPITNVDNMYTNGYDVQVA